MAPWFHTPVAGAVAVAVAALAVGAGLTGCAFDADYGDTRLACPPSSPRCPEGFACVDEVCTRAGAGDAGDAGPDASVDAPGTCELAAAEGTRDTCGQARDLTGAASVPGGTRVYGDTTGYANDLTPSTLPDCTTSPEPGADAIWRVAVTAGQTLAVTFAPEGWSGDVYVIDACTATASCEGGGPMFSTVNLTPTAGTYYIVVDARSPGEAGCFALDVALTP